MVLYPNLKYLAVIFSPACGGRKITLTQCFIVIYRFVVVC